MTASASWAARSRAAVWHPCTQMARLDAVPPLAIARGEGPWLIDMDGQRYFDAVGQLGGQFESICSASWGPMLQRIGLGVFTLRSSWSLSRNADLGMMYCV